MGRKVYGVIPEKSESDVEEKKPQSLVEAVVEQSQTMDFQSTKKKPIDIVIGILCTSGCIIIAVLVWSKLGDILNESKQTESSETIMSGYGVTENTTITGNTVSQPETTVMTDPTEVSFDVNNMSAEEIFNLSNELFETIEIPAEGMSEEEWNKRQAANALLWPTGMQNCGYVYQPEGSFEHYVDGTSAYVLKPNNNTLTEQEFIDQYFKEEVRDGEYSYYWDTGSRSDAEYLFQYKGKKVVYINISIADYEKAIALYELFLQELKNKYGEQNVEDIRNGDFYIIEQQSFADWHIDVHRHDYVGKDFYRTVSMSWFGGVYNNAWGSLNAGYQLRIYKVLDL